jgi:hypothetical protein|tara:strand:- start:255 stop:452 length:198 start_codon:yes stop_codon:yes gene_type:complete
MGAFKQSLAEIHESTLLVGVKVTASIFNVSEDYVKEATMAWDGYDCPWEEYVHNAQAQYGVVIEP